MATVGRPAVPILLRFALSLPVNRIQPGLAQSDATIATVKHATQDFFTIAWNRNKDMAAKAYTILMCLPPL